MLLTAFIILLNIYMCVRIHTYIHRYNWFLKKDSSLLCHCFTQFMSVASPYPWLCGFQTWQVHGGTEIRWSPPLSSFAREIPSQTPTLVVSFPCVVFIASTTGNWVKNRHGLRVWKHGNKINLMKLIGIMMWKSRNSLCEQFNLNGFIFFTHLHFWP